MTGLEIAWILGSILAIGKGIDRKNQKYKLVKDTQKGYSDIERANRKKTYDSTTEALNEALTKIDPDSAEFTAPNVAYSPDEFALPVSSNRVVSDAEKAMGDEGDFQLSQFGDALAEMENASGLLSLISPAISAAETEGMYGQSKIRGGQGVLDFQSKNIGGQGYDRMGDLLQQLGGLGMSYGINKSIG